MFFLNPSDRKRRYTHYIRQPLTVQDSATNEMNNELKQASDASNKQMIDESVPVLLFLYRPRVTKIVYLQTCPQTLFLAWFPQ